MEWTDRLRAVLASSLDGLRQRTEYTGDTPLFGSSPVGGVAVDKDTALQLSAFWGCVRYISSSLALLPWGTYKTTSNGGRKEQRSHPTWALLKESPSPGMSAFAWREAMLWNALVTGNAVSQITPSGLFMLDPAALAFKSLDGGIVYEYRGAEGNVILLPNEVYHLRGPSRDGLVGLSVIRAVRENIGLALAQQTYGSAFYGAGTHVGGIYEVTRDLTKTQIDALRQQIDEDKGARRAHRPRILTNGMTYKADTIPPQDAQYLESRKHAAREIASIFGVPPHKIGVEEGATAYASREQAAIEAVVDCLMPWTVRLEQESNMKLLTPKERASGVYTKLNMDVHMRGDAKTRAEFYQTMIRAGAMTPNQAREKEDMEADPDGNQLLVTRDLIPLSRMEEYADSQIAKNTEPAANEPLTAAAFEPLLVDAINCIQTRAKQDRARGRPPDKTREFARLKLEPLQAAHALAGLPFLMDELISKGVSDELV